MLSTYNYIPFPVVKVVERHKKDKQQEHRQNKDQQSDRNRILTTKVLHNESKVAIITYIDSYILGCTSQHTIMTLTVTGQLRCSHCPL